MLLGAKMKFYVLRLVEVRQTSQSTNLLKFELEISNDLASLLYLPLASSSDAMAMK
jgi:hypothetical protein